jgi:cell division septal protein FtsQ
MTLAEFVTAAGQAAGNILTGLKTPTATDLVKASNAEAAKTAAANKAATAAWLTPVLVIGGIVVVGIVLLLAFRRRG